MKKSKRSMRRAILESLYSHLQDAYRLEWPQEAFVDGHTALRDIDALLAFKSDPRIDELCRALDRLEQGTYGRCLACKGLIGQDLLDADPAVRMCASCERLYSHMLTQDLVIPLSASN